MELSSTHTNKELILSKIYKKRKASIQKKILEKEKYQLKLHSFEKNISKEKISEIFGNIVNEIQTEKKPKIQNYISSNLKKYEEFRDIEVKKFLNYFTIYNLFENRKKYFDHILRKMKEKEINEDLTEKKIRFGPGFRSSNYVSLETKRKYYQKFMNFTKSNNEHISDKEKIIELKMKNPALKQHYEDLIKIKNQEKINKSFFGRYFNFLRKVE